MIEDAVSVSSPDKEGFATVSGPAKTVTVGPGMVGIFTLENTKGKPKQEIQGFINRDGSFSGRVRATPGDKLKITLGTNTGDKKKLNKKVPQFTSHTTPALNAGRSAAFSTQGPGPPPEVIIRYKEAPKAAVAAVPLNPDEEVLQSGVLPPE